MSEEGEGDPLARIAEALLCSLCGVRLDEPRALACGHSYCLICADKQAGGRDAITCPACGRETALEGPGRAGALRRPHPLTEVLAVVEEALPLLRDEERKTATVKLLKMHRAQSCNRIVPRREMAPEVFSTDKEVSGSKLNEVYIETGPISRGKYVDLPVERLEVTVESHDQGWATGPGSWTWFEAGVIDPDGTEVCRHLLFRNTRGSRDWRSMSKVCGEGHPLVEALIQDSKLRIYARSMYHSWCIHVRQATIKIYYNNA